MSNDLTIQEQSTDLMLGGNDIVSLANQAQKRIEAMKTIKTCSLQMTNPKDWVDQNGKPYLQASGGEKIARLFNISWQIGEVELDEYEDGHFMYSYKGVFTLGASTIEVIGTRCSRDGFFKRYKWIKKEGEEDQKIELPPNTIDRGNVKKAALTNCFANGITRILGLRNLTYDDLKAAGIDVDQIDKVEYGNAEMSGDAKDKAKDTEKMLVEMYGKDYAAQLARMTENTDKNGKLWAGIRTLKGCSEKKLPIVHKQVKKEYENWKKTNVKQEPAQTASDKSTLLSTSSKEYQNAKDAMNKAETEQRVDEILASADGIFNAGAIKGLSAYADSRKKALAKQDPPF